MGASTELAGQAAPHEADQHAKLAERHGYLLIAGETIAAVVAAVSPEVPQPLSGFNGSVAEMPSYLAAKAFERSRATGRADAIRKHIGSTYSQFPASPDGYQIAITEQRVLVFNGDGSEVMSEGPIDAMRVTPILHQPDLTSLVFSNGSEHLAVTSRRGTSPDVAAFVSKFPDNAPALTVSSTPEPVAALVATDVIEF